MRIRMINGKDHIEWVLIEGREVFAKQADKSGIYRKEFASAHIAALWIIDQALFASNEMGYKFISV